MGRTVLELAIMITSFICKVIRLNNNLFFKFYEKQNDRVFLFCSKMGGRRKFSEVGVLGK